MSSKDVVERRQFPGAGVGLFAKKNLGSAEVILEDRTPFVAVLDSPTLRVACSWCFVYTEEALEDAHVTLQTCTGCRIVRYCSKTCQTAAWKHSHKWECKIYARLHPNVLPNTARMALQILLRRKTNAIGAAEWDDFYQLQYHVEDFQRQAQDGHETYQNLQLMARAAKEYAASSEDLGLVETLVGRLLINTLTLISPLFTPLGLLLSLPVSRANNSCVPNAIPTLSGRTLTFRTLDAVKQDEQVTISYTDITFPPETRRQALQERYHFWCECSACKAGQTLGQPDPPPSVTSVPGSLLDPVLDNATAYLTQASATPLAQRLVPLARALRAFDPLKPPAHPYPAYRPPLSRIYSDLILALLAQQRFVPALICSVQTHLDADPVFFAQELHPARVARTWVLTRLLFQVSSLVHDPDANADTMPSKENGTLSESQDPSHKAPESAKAISSSSAALQKSDRDAAEALTSEFGISLPLSVYILVADVASKVDRSHGADSRLAHEVHGQHAQLQHEIRAMGGQAPTPATIAEVYAAWRTVADRGWTWWCAFERQWRNQAGCLTLKDPGNDAEADGIAILIEKQ